MRRVHEQRRRWIVESKKWLWSLSREGVRASLRMRFGHPPPLVDRSVMGDSGETASKDPALRSKLGLDLRARTTEVLQRKQNRVVKLVSMRDLLIGRNDNGTWPGIGDLYPANLLELWSGENPTAAWFMLPLVSLNQPVRNPKISVLLG
jgi:hypothetical protein